MTTSIIRLVMFNVLVIDGENKQHPVFDLCAKMLKKLKPVYKRMPQFEAETGRGHDWMYIRQEKLHLSKMRTTLRRVCEIYGVDYKACSTQYHADMRFNAFQD